MDVKVQKFFGNFDALQKKGIPSLMVLNDKLLTLSNYKQKMAMVPKDSSKLSGI
jgi:hypothetical protein